MGSLVKYVAIGGIACYSMAVMYKYQLNGKLKNASYYKDAMQLLKEHKSSDLLLGQPMYISSIDVFSPKNYADASTAKIHVPVRGSKCKGIVYFAATRNEDGKWTVNRVELEIKDEQGGTVLIFDDKKNISVSE